MQSRHSVLYSKASVQNLLLCYGGVQYWLPLWTLFPVFFLWPFLDCFFKLYCDWYIFTIFACVCRVMNVSPVICGEWWPLMWRICLGWTILADWLHACSAVPWKIGCSSFNDVGWSFLCASIICSEVTATFYVITKHSVSTLVSGPYFSTLMKW